MAQNLLASPPAAAGAANNSTSTSNNNNNNATATTSPLSASKQSPNQNQQRLAVLRLKRQDLEKRLQEKNSLLQELCRKEAHLIGVYPTVTVAGQEAHHPSSSADDIGGLLQGNGKTAHNTHSLPRKIGTGFTLSEKYLNKRAPSANSPLNAPAQREDEELNSLLLQRDIQQQICKASLKLLNDVALTKSVRRKHKSSYEAAQQKLMDIGKGLTGMQRKQQQQQQNSEFQHPEAQHHPGTSHSHSHHHHHQQQVNSQTLPLTVKTNFKVPQQQHQQYSGESPVMDRNVLQQKRNRHDSYSNPHHSPASLGYPSTVTGDCPPGHNNNNKGGLYRSSSNSSSLNNANVLGKSSLSLDNSNQHQSHQLPPNYPQSAAPQHPHQQFSSLGQAKPISYESKSLHNFVMSSPNHSSVASYQLSPHHHPALLSPTFYHHHQTQSYATAGRSAANHYPGNSAGLRQSHQQQQQQFMSPPPQQVVIPQSGLGGYWTLNESNERVWCASSSSYSPDPGTGTGGQPPTTHQRHASATLDRKQAIYLPSTSASHGKLKMPSPEASPTSHNGGGHLSQAHHNQQQQQQQQSGYGLQDGSGYNNNSGKSFSIVSSISFINPIIDSDRFPINSSSTKLFSSLLSSLLAPFSPTNPRHWETSNFCK